MPDNYIEGMNREFLWIKSFEEKEGKPTGDWWKI